MRESEDQSKFPSTSTSGLQTLSRSLKALHPKIPITSAVTFKKIPCIWFQQILLCEFGEVVKEVHGFMTLPIHLTPHAKPTIPCPSQSTDAAHLEYQRSTLSLLITTIKLLAPCFPTRTVQERGTYPSSKCLQRFNANCAFVLHDVHSSLRTTFFVVLAFLWKTGLV